MYLRPLLTVSAFAIATSSAFAGPAAKSGYALAGQGKTLVVMKDLSKPADIKTFDLTKSISAIAYRPVTGDLLGFTNGSIYKINPATGELKDLGAKFKADAKTKSGAAVAFDFNNKIDAVRAVSSAGDNLVYFPTGFGNGDEKADSVRRFTSLAYADGDKNSGKTPAVFANAYTNAINGKKASGTFQYALDAETDSLISLANNKGTLATIGKIKIDGKPADVTQWGGFDITSAKEGKDDAYAIMQVEGKQTAGLYSVDLKSGETKTLANLPIGGITGFAVSAK